MLSNQSRNAKNIYETVLNSIEGGQLLDGLMMNYFQCDAHEGFSSVVRLVDSLANGYSTLNLVKRHQMFQMERYLAVG